MKISDAEDRQRRAPSERRGTGLVRRLASALTKTVTKSVGHEAEAADRRAEEDDRGEDQDERAPGHGADRALSSRRRTCP